ncbi:hypothetical protein PPACK8108_LOCUS16394 [Phakopsora pachyrhizi]|uniref:DDE Tnp4 domain-containing protein n=1 Tax=Phakopsora pachyrhizi TaxID=170000 RepID=A0AAV0B9A9_PHAPC|nr:hypothetical protein PPACK8108_LOCUS16394 [Phakopsora pachyrhizi]
MPHTLSPREQLAQTIRELEIEDLMESESDSDREEDILLLHDLYTKRYLVTQSSINHFPSNFKQLTQKAHITFGKLCDLLRIQVAVGLSRLGSTGNGASLGKIQMIFGDHTIKWPSKEEQKESIQVMQMEGFPNCVGFVDGTTIPLSQKPALDRNYILADSAYDSSDVVVPAYWVSTCTTEEKITFNTKYNVKDKSGGIQGFRIKRKEPLEGGRALQSS